MRIRDVTEIALGKQIFVPRVERSHFSFLYKSAKYKFGRLGLLSCFPLLSGLGASVIMELDYIVGSESEWEKPSWALREEQKLRARHPVTQHNVCAILVNGSMAATLGVLWALLRFCVLGMRGTALRPDVATH